MVTGRWIVLTFLLAFSCPAAAANRQQFDIPAQSLRGALISLASQADISIGLTNVTLTNRTSRTLTEYVSVEEALQKLLGGTDLAFEMIDPATWRIFPRPTIVPAPHPHETTTPLTQPPIDEITVTAAKRPLALQTASTSIAAVTEKTVVEYGAHSAQDMTSFVAGFTATNQSPGRNKYMIRGLADGPFIGNTQSTVGVYIDETRAIYNAPDPNLQLFDVDRVEVIPRPAGIAVRRGIHRRPCTHHHTSAGAR